jgi:hypothetical protein
MGGTMSDWQPIETAPRDGKSVLLFYPDQEPAERLVVGWFENFGPYEKEMGAAGMWSEGGYVSKDGSIVGGTGPHPTHWLPIPEPPQ